MNTAFVIFLISVVAGIAQEKRSINGQTLVVSSNWIHLRASYVGESPVGWILDGTFGTNSGRFILKNPPVEKLVEFNRLKQARDSLAAGRTQDALSRAELNRGGTNRRYARIRQAQIRALDNETKKYSSEIQQIDAEAKKKGYDLGNAFVLTDEAMGTPSQYQKMLILDRGIPVPAQYPR